MSVSTASFPTLDLTPAKLFGMKDMIAVVTGGGTGLMIAQGFCAAGAKVYIASRRLEVVEQAAKKHTPSGSDAGTLIPMQVNITDKESVKRFAEEIGKREGHVDVLVNNSGISGPHTSVEKGSESAEALRDELWNGEDMAGWDDVWRTNVSGHYFTSVAFLPLLSKTSELAGAGHAEKGGKGHWRSSIINIASMSGITRMSQHHLAYNASKSASIHLTKMMASELARSGVAIRCNAISPGIFPSEMTAKSREESTGKSVIVDQEKEKYGEQKGIPTNRPGNEEDMVQLAVMLAKNGYITGENVTIDGGYLLAHP